MDLTKFTVILFVILPSPRGKRAGPKGLRAEGARAVTGRRCPHSGEGEDFLTGQLNFSFLRNSGPDGFRCPSGSFFLWPGRFPRIALNRTKIKGSCTSVVTQAQNGQKKG